MAGKRVAVRDKEIGLRVRALRLEKGLSQTQLATRIGVTFQQVQKYENGVNRISASRLQRIAELLDVPIPFFFEVAQTPSGDDPLAYLRNEGAVKLLRAYDQITNIEGRSALIEIAEQLARASKSASRRPTRRRSS
jgi:transcriptional regulator with XRE-family HTH domain